MNKDIEISGKLILITFIVILTSIGMLTYCGIFEKKANDSDEIIETKTKNKIDDSSVHQTTNKQDNNERQNMNVKTVYLIRHAESSENHRLACLSRSVTNMGKLTLPNKEDISTSLELINIKGQIDSDVSAKGKKQISQLGEKLRQDDFVVEKKIQLVAHSPLKRARQTSEGLLGCVTAKPEMKNIDISWEGKQAATVNRVIELPSLVERTIFEWVPIYHDTFMNRIHEFESWLNEQTEERIAIVGHSQYFKTMLGLPYKFGNCDVWELKYTPKSKSIPSPDFTKTKEPDENECTKSDDETKNGKNLNDKVCQMQEDVILPRGWSGLTKLYSYQSKSE